MKLAYALAGLAAGLTLLAMGSCLPPAGPGPGPGPAPGIPGAEPGPAPPAAQAGEPDVRVGLVVGAPQAMLSGDGELIVAGPDGSQLARIPAGEIWRAAIVGTGIVLSGPGGWSATPMEVVDVVPTDPAFPVRVNGRPYRGSLSLLRAATGVTVVNRLGLEAYVQGVVSAEMGRRLPADREALRAQAVVSRTYAVRTAGRWRAQGFDFYATVSDQVYGGLASETAAGAEAVASTRGLIATFGGAPIDAFFFSTCGGRTEQGTEIFRAAARPYLHSQSDADGSGQAYCRISPRYRWRESWTGEALRASLRRSLPALAGVGADRLREVRDVRVTRHTVSGRAGELAIALASGGEVVIDGPSIRQALLTPEGNPLRSTGFTLAVTGAGRRVTRLVAEGGGAGHGVGFCQWGAVGRARAGQGYPEIIAAYYPGTELARLY